jgi:hypothetical protein
MLRQFTTAISPDRFARHAKSLGLSVDSLSRLRIGWSARHGAWAFPMCAAALDAVTGFRLRFEDGKKLSVRGGREGLFIPENLRGDGPLVICEGPTSCAALLDLGFDAVGRPSCSGGIQTVKELLDGLRARRDVVVFGDRDTPKPLPNGGTFLPGQNGARRLAREILALTRSLKVVIPPYAKDARAWVQAGASRAVVEAVIRATNSFRKEQRDESE